MPTLVAVSYPDETTAGAAAEEVLRLAGPLAVDPESVAAVSRNRDGTFQVSTHHHAVARGGSWGTAWGVLFGALLFVPVQGGPATAGIDPSFQGEVRLLVQPGTSAMFLVVAAESPDAAVDALGRFGGTVLTSSLSEEHERRLLAAIGG